jgi:hypothetical protein
MQHQAPAGGRDPGRHVDDPGPQGRPACTVLVACDRGCADEVERDHRVGDPGCVGRVLPAGQVRQRPVLEFGDDLLDDRVVTVALVGLDQRQGAVGD